MRPVTIVIFFLITTGFCITGCNLKTTPSADGVVLLRQPFSPGFADISKNIPLMIGSTLNELMPTVYGEKNLTIKQAKDRLAEEYGDKTDRYISLFAKTPLPFSHSPRQKDFKMDLRTMLFMSVLMNNYRNKIIAKNPPGLAIKTLGIIAGLIRISY
ncbi:MAG TPA: hypothetical protein VK155_11410 [Bacteroidales bacterium]|jgi:hypothetical protein|nr:hypothetical protein [Bacteroidales bacterium]